MRMDRCMIERSKRMELMQGEKPYEVDYKKALQARERIR
jgi:hypothetical protein